MTDKLSREDCEALINSFPFALTNMASTAEVAGALSTSNENPTSQADYERLKEAAGALCKDWTKRFPQGFHEDKDEHREALDKLCQRFCESERWHHVFGNFWQARPISLRKAIIRLAAEHNRTLLAKGPLRQKPSEELHSSEAAANSPVAATNSHISDSVPGGKRKRVEDDDESTLVVSDSETEQQCFDEISASTSKLRKIFQRKTHQHGQQITTRDTRIQELEQKLAQRDNEAAAFSAAIKSQKDAHEQELLRRDSEHSHSVIKLKDEKSCLEVQLKTSINEAIRAHDEVEDLKHGRDRHATELKGLQNRLDIMTKEAKRLQADLDTVRKEKERLHKQLTAAKDDNTRARSEASAAKRSVSQLKQEKKDAEDKHEDLQRRVAAAEGDLDAVQKLLNRRRDHGHGDQGAGEADKAERSRKRR